MKKPLILEYTVTKEIIIPREKLTKEELKYLKLNSKNEDDYTYADWNFIDSHSFMDILKRFLPEEEKKGYLDEEIVVVSY